MNLRTAPRIPVQFPTVFAGDRIVGEGTVINLSVPGCAIKTSKPLRQGDYLELRMLMPDHMTPLAVDVAKVRWASNGEFGLQFIRIEPENQHRLGEFLQQQPDVAPLM